MPAIYLASKTNESVVKISNPKLPPEYPFWMDADWREVDYSEFKKIRAAIQRHQRGSRRTQNALDTPSAVSNVVAESNGAQMSEFCYSLLAFANAAEHSVEPTLKKCPSCGADEGDCFVWCPRGN